MSELKEMLEKNRLEVYQKFKDFLYDLRPSYPRYHESGIKGEKHPTAIEIEVVYTDYRSGPTKEDVPSKIIMTLMHVSEYGWSLPSETVTYSINGVSEKELVGFLMDEMSFKVIPTNERRVQCFAL